MKITTGLVPAVRAQPNGGFLTDFATVADSHKAPRGSVVASVYSENEPRIEKKGFSYSYVTGIGRTPSAEGLLRHEGVPEDANQKTVQGSHPDTYARHFEWYEVTL